VTSRWSRRILGPHLELGNNTSRLGGWVLPGTVVLIACRPRSTYDRGRPLRPWLAGIAFRVVQENGRRVRREQPDSVVDVADPALLPEQRLAVAQARALVRDVLARLPDQHRVLVIMHELEPIPAPAQTRRRTVAKLRAWLLPLGSDPSPAPRSATVRALLGGAAVVLAGALLLPLALLLAVAALVLGGNVYAQDRQGPVTSYAPVVPTEGVRSEDERSGGLLPSLASLGLTFAA
jgi:hypothetical protein